MKIILVMGSCTNKSRRGLRLIKKNCLSLNIQSLNPKKNFVQIIIMLSLKYINFY